MYSNRLSNVIYLYLELSRIGTEPVEVVLNGISRNWNSFSSTSICLMHNKLGTKSLSISVKSFGFNSKPHNSFQIGSATDKLSGDPVRIAMAINTPRNRNIFKCNTEVKDEFKMKQSRLVPLSSRPIFKLGHLLSIGH